MAKNYPVEYRCDQMEKVVIAAGDEGIPRQEAAKLCQITASRAADILRILRNRRRVMSIGGGSNQRWITTNSPVAQAAIRERQARRLAQTGPTRYELSLAASEWADAWSSKPIVHARISANDAPRIQRTKPYSVFTLAA